MAAYQKNEAFAFNEFIFPSLINEIYFHELIDSLNKQGRENILKIITDNPENPRLNYVCRFIFRQHLGISYQLIKYSEQDTVPESNNIIEYSNEKKISYSLHMKKDGWLDQTGKPEKIVSEYIYVPDKETILNKDFFSFIFFHISRYEEWANTNRDRHGRFEAIHSLLFQKKIHEYPVVNIGINLLKNILIEKNFIPNPKNTFPEIKKFLTIDIDNGYAFQGKGFFRTVGAFGKDLIKGHLNQILQRYKVLTGKIPDPFDVYEELYRSCTANNTPLLYFVLLSDQKPHNRFLQKGNPLRKKLFHTLLSNTQIPPALHASYESNECPDLYTKESDEFKSLTGYSPSMVRHHFLRFDIRTTPAYLIYHNFKASFDMGFASSQGFRAGTWSPFLYFNFHKNKPENLWFFPFCAMDGNYFIYENHTTDSAWENLKKILTHIKNENGTACIVFHERTLSPLVVENYNRLLNNFLEFR
jgi:hypothetical protein